MLKVQAFLPYKESDYEWTTLADGTYSRAQVFATNHPANALAHHLPRHDMNIHGVVVKDSMAIGIVVLQTAAEVERNNRSNAAPEPEPIPSAAASVHVPAQSENEGEPVAINWWSKSDADVRAELARRGLPVKGTRKERVARLEA